MKKQSTKKKVMSLKEFKEGFLRRKKRASCDNFALSAIWVRNILHEDKVFMESARENTSECVTIKPPKDVFDAIVAGMIAKK